MACQVLAHNKSTCAWRLPSPSSGKAGNQTKERSSCLEQVPCSEGNGERKRGGKALRGGNPWGRESAQGGEGSEHLCVVHQVAGSGVVSLVPGPCQEQTPAVPIK